MLKTNIHSTAVIDPTAIIGEGVEIGAYSIIMANVEIGRKTKIHSHVVITGPTQIGKNNEIYSHATVGGDPQDLSYEEGQDSFLKIGDGNIIREFCTINRGTEKESSITRIGDNNMIMAYVHIAHDCILGDNIVLTNNTALAGHVRIYDWAVLGGFTLVKQFVNIGSHTYIGMGCKINKDIPHYMVVSGTDPRVSGINSIGMKRRGISYFSISEIKRAYKKLYREDNSTLLCYVMEDIENNQVSEIGKLIDFIKSSKNGILR